ncbi:Rft protein [Toxoplasma gondii VAND]|uniref:Man(5)GlcNAc(2)-PP-dolichol translocation protein RFT1 n=1 Tax=Toxoplasma gondii VAND TaxID=933077 RepID=A0A086PQJ3_TOXGO|nr:Rft protein [Toxoplasma gondii VAND]
MYPTMQEARKSPSPAPAAAPAVPAPGRASVTPFLLQTLSKLLSVSFSILISRLFGLPSHILAAAVFYLPALQTTGLFVMREALRRATARPVASDLSVSVHASGSDSEAHTKAQRTSASRPPSPERVEGASRAKAPLCPVQRNSLCSSLNLAYLGSVFSIVFSLLLAVVWIAVPPILRSGTDGREGANFLAQTNDMRSQEKATRAVLEAAGHAATLWSYRICVVLFFSASVVEAAAEPLLIRVLLQVTEPHTSDEETDDGVVEEDNEEERSWRNGAFEDVEGKPAMRGVWAKDGEGGRRTVLTKDSGENGARISCKEQETLALSAEAACRHRALAEAAATLGRTLTVLCLLGVLHFLRLLIVDLHLKSGTACGDASSCDSQTLVGRAAKAPSGLGTLQVSPGETAVLARLVLSLTVSHPLLAFAFGQVVYSLVWFFRLMHAAQPLTTQRRRKRRPCFFTELRRYLEAVSHIRAGRCSCGGRRCAGSSASRAVATDFAASVPAESGVLCSAPPRPTWARWLPRLRGVCQAPQRARERLLEAARRLTVAEHRRLLRVSFGLMVQKFLGVEGEKLLLLALLSPDAAGEFAFVTGAASIFPRLLFGPVEDAAFTAFCALHGAGALGSKAPPETLDPSAPERRTASTVATGPAETKARDDAGVPEEAGGLQRRQGLVVRLRRRANHAQPLSPSSLRRGVGGPACSDQQRPAGLGSSSSLGSLSMGGEDSCGALAPGGEEVDGGDALEERKGEGREELLGPSVPLLRLLLALEGTIGLVAATCGPVFARVAVRLIYGPRWGNCPGAVAALQVYSVYILLIAVFGLLDAHALATAPPAMLRLLRRLKGWATALHLVVLLPAFVSFFPERQAAAVVAAQCLYTFFGIIADVVPVAFRLASVRSKRSRSLETLCIVRHLSSLGTKSDCASESSGVQLAVQTASHAPAIVHAPDTPHGRNASPDVSLERGASRRRFLFAKGLANGGVKDREEEARESETHVWGSISAEEGGGAEERANAFQERLRLADLLPHVFPAALALLPPSPLSLVLPILLAASLAVAAVSSLRRSAQESCAPEESAKDARSDSTRRVDFDSDICLFESRGGEPEELRSCRPGRHKRMRQKDRIEILPRDSSSADSAFAQGDSQVLRVMGVCAKEWHVEVLLGFVVACGLVLSLSKPCLTTLTLLQVGGVRTQVPLLGSLTAAKT